MLAWEALVHTGAAVLPANGRDARISTSSPLRGEIKVGYPVRILISSPCSVPTGVDRIIGSDRTLAVN